MMKYLFAALALLLGVGTAHACNVPNPNLNAFVSGQLLVDGCVLPAVALNRLVPNPFLGSLSGTVTTTNLLGSGYGIDTLLGIVVTSDKATNNVLSPSANTAEAVQYSFGGANSGEASRIGLWVDLEQAGPVPLGTGLHAFDTGIFANVVSNSNLGGVPGSPVNGAGQMYGYSAQVACGPSFTYTYGCVGGEIDLAVASATTGIKEIMGFGAVALGAFGDTQHGTRGDQGVGVWASSNCGSGTGAGGSGCAGVNTALAFGRADSYIPVPAAGTLIGITSGIGNTNVTNGVDFSRGGFTGCAWKSPGSCIDGGGNYIELKNFPTIILKDTQIANPQTNGGYVRLISVGSSPDSYQWQINTAAAGDFSATIVALGITSLGDIITPNLPSSAGAGGLYICVDNTGAQYKKSACP